jgi:hypothetical protein
MVELFEPSYGNCNISLSCISRKDKWSKKLRELKSSFIWMRAEFNNMALREYAYPALTSARYAKWFTFTKQDWERS